MPRRVLRRTVGDDERAIESALLSILSEARQITGTSLRDLEETTGIGNQNIARLFRNGHADARTLKRLLDAFGAKIEVKVTLPPSTRKNPTS